MTGVTWYDKKSLESVAANTSCDNYFKLKSNTLNSIICSKQKIGVECARYMKKPLRCKHFL